MQMPNEQYFFDEHPVIGFVVWLVGMVVLYSVVVAVLC